MRIITLDPASPDIAAAILELAKRSRIVVAALAGVSQLPPLWETPEELATCGDFFLGATCDESLAGFASYHLTEGVLAIQQVVVEPGYARRGVGRALVHAMLNLTHARAIATSSVGDTHSRVLYQRTGFQWVGTSEDDLGVKVLHFSRNQFMRSRAALAVPRPRRR